MKLLLAAPLLVLVLSLVQWANVCVSESESDYWWISMLCREEKRSALLHINATLLSLSNNGIWYWHGKDDKDCCQWEGVTCDPITGHITQLDLSTSDIDYHGVILLNTTMFLPLHHLRFLSLSGNGIYNCTDDTGFESWSNLTKLELLDLSYNNLPKSIISSIARVSSLRALYLDDNYMGGNVPVKELSALNLEVVSLSGCVFNGSFPYLGHWSSLRTLSLASNALTGTLTSKGLCRLQNLEELDLSFNHIAGNLPLCMGNLSSLRLVDLQHNNFQVKFPSYIFERLVSLRYLSLSYNQQFEGTLFLKLFLNHSNLKVLRLSTWSLRFRVEVVDLPFQLQILELANCILNVEPTFLYSQYKLEVLDLSNTGSKGHVMTFLENNTNLIKLNLHKNKLVGNISEDIGEMMFLITLDLSNNHLSGVIPNSLSNLWYLKSLDLSHNSFIGEIPRGLTNLTSLESFSVAYNDLSGPTLGVKQQFRIFDNSSYEGNPNLCGPPLSKTCFPNFSGPPLFTTQPFPNNNTDLLILFGSFSISFVVSFWGFMAILYFKRNWRCVLFTLVDRYSSMIYVKIVLSTKKIGAAQT